MKFQVQTTVNDTQELWTLFSDTVTCCTLINMINMFVTTSVIPLYAHPDSQIPQFAQSQVATKWSLCQSLPIRKMQGSHRFPVEVTAKESASL